MTTMTSNDGGLTLEERAHAVHAAYCKHFGKVGYDLFSDCWIKAAGVVQACDADPDWFVESQKDQMPELDPEDLAHKDARARYLRAYAERAKELIYMFRYSEVEYANMVKNADLEPVSALIAMLLGFQSTFRVVKAKSIFVPEDAARVIGLHGREAAVEIRSSKHFRLFIQAKYPQLDMPAFLDELDRVSGAWWAALAAKTGGDNECPSDQ